MNIKKKELTFVEKVKAKIFIYFLRQRNINEARNIAEFLSLFFSI